MKWCEARTTAEIRENASAAARCSFVARGWGKEGARAPLCLALRRMRFRLPTGRRWFTEQSRGAPAASISRRALPVWRNMCYGGMYSSSVPHLGGPARPTSAEAHRPGRSCPVLSCPCPTYWLSDSHVSVATAGIPRLRSSALNLRGHAASGAGSPHPEIYISRWSGRGLLLDVIPFFLGEIAASSSETSLKKCLITNTFLILFAEAPLSRLPTDRLRIHVVYFTENFRSLKLIVNCCFVPRICNSFSTSFLILLWCFYVTLVVKPTQLNIFSVRKNVNLVFRINYCSEFVMKSVDTVLIVLDVT